MTTVANPGRLHWLRHTRAIVADRLARAEAADPGTDPIGHRLDEYRACIAELDAWIAELDVCSCPQSADYRQLNRGCPQHGDAAEAARRAGQA